MEQRCANKRVEEPKKGLRSKEKYGIATTTSVTTMGLRLHGVLPQWVVLLLLLERLQALLLLRESLPNRTGLLLAQVQRDVRFVSVKSPQCVLLFLVDHRQHARNGFANHLDFRQLRRSTPPH